jgi:hypothetical protein
MQLGLTDEETRALLNLLIDTIKAVGLQRVDNSRRACRDWRIDDGGSG